MLRFQRRQQRRVHLGPPLEGSSQREGFPEDGDLIILSDGIARTGAAVIYLSNPFKALDFLGLMCAANFAAKK